MKHVKVFGVIICIAACYNLMMQITSVLGECRKAVVAGRFYPGDKSALENDISSYLKNAVNADIPHDAKIRGLISPHAGYIYSGIVAASGYKMVSAQKDRLKTVVMLAPSHRIGFRGVYIHDVDCFETPLGRVPLSDKSSSVRNALNSANLHEGDNGEHSMEVELPFLQVVLKNFNLIPVLLGSLDPISLAEDLLPFIDEQTLVVASSDLSHYYAYNIAKDKDTRCVNAIETLDLQNAASCEACGLGGILALMRMALLKSWKAILIDYKNSGDTAGDKNHVVGYAGILFYETKEGQSAMSSYSHEERDALLKLARNVIASEMEKSGKTPEMKNPTPALREKRGCFVTLHKKGELRGCIGSIMPEKPLVDCVSDNAINAAFSDPRFPGLSKDELSQVDIEISVLTLPKKLEYKDAADLLAKIIPKRHGLIISKGWHRSTFLPQVWEQLPDKERFLGHLCQKAGLPANAWKAGDLEVQTYEVEHFGEI